MADIQSFDIGIMPLLEDKWTKGKCALKLLQYLSCGVASVSSFTSVTNKIIQNGQNGFLAQTNDEWISNLKILLKNYNIRKEFSERGRSSILGRFDSTTIVKKYSVLFGNCISSFD